MSMNPIPAVLEDLIKGDESRAQSSTVTTQSSLKTLLPKHAELLSNLGRLSQSPDNNDTWEYKHYMKGLNINHLNKTKDNADSPVINGDRPVINSSQTVVGVFPGFPKTLEVSEQMLLFLGVPKEVATGMLDGLLHDLQARAHQATGIAPGSRGLALWKIQQLPDLVIKRLPTETMTQINHTIRQSSSNTPQDRVVRMVYSRSWLLRCVASRSEEVEFDLTALEELKEAAATTEQPVTTSEEPRKATTTD